MRLQPLQQLVACGHKGVGGGVVQRLVDLRVGFDQGDVPRHLDADAPLQQDGSQQFGQLFALCVAVGARPAGVLSRLGLFLFFGAEAPIAALPLL